MEEPGVEHQPIMAARDGVAVPTDRDGSPPPEAQLAYVPFQLSDEMCKCSNCTHLAEHTHTEFARAFTHLSLIHI